MEYLGFNDDTIADFKDKGKVYVSDELTGTLKELSTEQRRFIKQFEEENNTTVYHVISGDYRFMDGKVMRFDSYLQANGYKDEWQMDREDLKSGFTYGYVNNITIPEYSEFGSFGFTMRDGVLHRNDRGYNFEPLKANELAEKIDDFCKNYDYYEYFDTENYKGSHYDSVFEDVKKGQLKEEKNFLKGIANGEERYMKNEAKELISDIDRYMKNYEKNIKISEIKVGKGMKM